MMRRRGFILAFGFVLAAAAGCDRKSGAAGDPPRGGAPARAQIAVVPKGTTHEFWKSVHAGSVKAARELGAEVIWKGPVREDDRDEQIKVVEAFLSRGVAGIVLAPLDDRALVPVLKDAAARAIPVVIIDSAVHWDGQVSFVATDNEKAGALAAQRLGEQLSGRGQVIVMRYQEGSASTAARESGFLSALAQKFPELRVVSESRYAGATTETAYATAENLLSTHKDVNGVFCPNESTTFGMLRALEGAGRAGKLRFVGFDASPKLVEALAQGKIDALVVQNPLRMGELGVRALMHKLQGKSVEKRIDTGASLVTRDNMQQPAMQALLAPDVGRYLN